MVADRTGGEARLGWQNQGKIGGAKQGKIEHPKSWTNACKQASPLSMGATSFFVCNSGGKIQGPALFQGKSNFCKVPGT